MKGRSALLAGVSAVAVFVGGAGWAEAQTTQSPGPIATSRGGDPDRSQSTQVQEVVVTGSRIAKPNLDQPTPISTLSPMQIEDAGTANLGDIIQQLPEVGTEFGVRGNSNNFGSSAGVSAIDLHNLGVSRTLVLVDGQRHVAGDIGSDAVDTNSIPAALVDHVEVITGGASAIYGSDAVSGVVNIILKKNFEGMDIQAQGGEYDAGFGSRYSASGTFGHNFDGGRANVTFSAFWNHEEGISAHDLPYDRNYGTITNPNDLSGPLDPTFYSSPAAIIGDHIPDKLTVPNVGSDYVTRNGTLFSAMTGLPITLFNSNGTPAGVPTRSGYNSFAFAQLNNCPTGECYFPETYTQVSSPIETHGFEITGHYDITPHLRASLDAKGLETIVQNVIQPDFSFGAAAIAPDNAFLTPAAAALVNATYAAGDEPLYGAFLNDNRSQNINRQTYRIVGQLSGDFDVRLADVKWDGALNYGKTESRFNQNGIEIVNNFAAALDSVIDPATGQAVCRTPPAGGGACVPFNPFGGQQSAAMQNYSFGRFGFRDYLDQEDANLNATADTGRFFKLPGGPVSLAAGGEYRIERTHERNDEALLNGSTDYLAANSAGSFNVYEGYVELNLPFVRHMGPLLDEISVDLAYRAAHYSTVGEADADKIEAIYAPVSWIKFRGTFSEAVRAPDITEAYSPTQSTYFNVTDPCSAENISTNLNYARNCAAAGVPANFVANTNASIVGQTSGNPNLGAEKSLSYTGGIVFQPPIIPHLSITGDYYSILIKDAITNVAAQDIIDNCYNNSAGLSSQYCSLFTRNSANNINFVQTTYVNAAKLYTKGVELQFDYQIGVAGLTQRWKYSSWLDGLLGLNLDLNYVLRLRNFPFQTNPGQYNVYEGAITTAEGDVPNLRGLGNITYRQGPVHLDYQIRYLGRAARFNRDPTQADFVESTDQPYAGAKFFHNVTVRYDLPGSFLRGAQVYVGCNDLYGEKPPLGLVQGSDTDQGYDLGRYIFGGIRIRR